MALAFLRKVPQSPVQWEVFHFQHWNDHRQILSVISKKVNSTLFLPPIWPIPGNVYTKKVAEWHNQLHIEMNAVSHSPSSDLSIVDLATPEGALNFIEPNYRDHYSFHQLIGVPV